MKIHKKIFRTVPSPILLGATIITLVLGALVIIAVKHTPQTAEPEYISFDKDSTIPASATPSTATSSTPSSAPATKTPVNEPTTKPKQKASPSPTTTSTPTPAPTATPAWRSFSIYTYPEHGSTKQSLSKINIIPAFFAASDQDVSISTTWRQNLDTVGSAIADFYRSQFEGNVSVSMSAVPDLIKSPTTLSASTFNSIQNEVYQATKNMAVANSYNIWMIIVVRSSSNSAAATSLGGTMGDGSGLTIDIPTAMQFEFWLDDDALHANDPYGMEGWTHEIGHALGIPHPWSLPANTSGEANFGNVPGDVMGYVNNNIPFKDLYLRSDVKAAMGLPER